MRTGRVVLIVTCVVVAGLGVWFAVARWEDANRVATVASALGALAAVGVAVWAALRSSRPGLEITLSETGDATAGGQGNANTGISGHADQNVRSIDISKTGNARSLGDGDANTGVDIS